MALTPSNMMPLGTVAPPFNLLDTVSGHSMSLEDVRGQKCTLVMFICNHCPFVKHIEAGLAALGKSYQGEGIGLVAISSNDIEQYPDDGPEAMTLNAKEKGYPFPYLFDSDQAIAKAYDATCTPDFFLFDGQLKCVYRGQLDESRPNNGIEVTGEDLRAAIDAVLAGTPVTSEQKPSMGCNIKWKTS